MILAAGVGYSILVKGSIGTFTLIAIAIIAVIAEVLEFTLSGTYARKYGGSKRASWAESRIWRCQTAFSVVAEIRFCCLLPARSKST